MRAFDDYTPVPYFVEEEQEATKWRDHFLQSIKITGSLGLDSETSGLTKHKDQVIIWSLSDGANRICLPAKFIPLYREAILENPAIDFDLTNAKFDAHMFANSGADISKAGKWRCTLPQSFLWDENRQGRHGLKECTREFLGREPPTFEQVFGKLPPARKGVKRTQADLINEALADPVRRLQASEYASLDAYNTFTLRRYLSGLLSQVRMFDDYTLNDFYEDVEAPFTKVLWRMERRGFQIDAGYLYELKIPMEQKMAAVEKEFAKRAGQIVNLKSHAHVRWFFCELLGKQPVKMTSGGTKGVPLPSIDEEVLEQWAGEGDVYAKLMLDHRKLAKIHGTYVASIMDLLDQRFRLHTTLNQIGAQSGRLSSSDPNCQNIPAPQDDEFKIRDAFIAGFNKRLIVADYEQLEMRLMAHRSGDQKMIDAINKGIDIHCLSVSEMHGIPYDEVVAAKKADKLVKEGKRPQQPTLTPREEDLLRMRQDAKACVHPDTIITFNGETRSIISAVRSKGLAPTEVGPQPLPAWVSDGRAGNALVQSVSPLYNKPGLHVLTRRGVLTCSEDHLFPTADGRLVPAKDLKVGDELPETTVPVATDRSYPQLRYRLFKGTPPVQIELNDKVAYFAGVFAGDGYQGGAHAIGIAHGPEDEIDKTGKPYSDWKKSIIASANAIGLDAMARHRRVYLGSRHTQLYFNALELMDGNKKRLRVPNWVLRAGRTAILNFLGGLIDTDGSVEKKLGFIAITTKDPIFAGQIAVAIRSAGLRVAVEPSWNRTYERYYYRLRIPAADAYVLKPFMRHTGKIERIRDGIRPLSQQKNIVTLVEPAGTIPCFDLTLASEDHLYLTSGLLTHNCGFGIIYGIGGPRLAAQLTRSSGRLYEEHEGWTLIKKWLDVFPGVRDYIEAKKKEMRLHGCVRTLVGRFRRCGDLSSMSKGEASAQERTLVNATIQGSAADVAKAAMLKADADQILKELGAEMLLQVHDELVFEVPDDDAVVDACKKRIKELMEHPFDQALSVPLPISIGSGYSWATAK